MGEVDYDILDKSLLYNLEKDVQHIEDNLRGVNLRLLLPYESETELRNTGSFVEERDGETHVVLGRVVVIMTQLLKPKIEPLPCYAILYDTESDYSLVFKRNVKIDKI